MENTKTKKEKAAFGAGCFWGVEESFRTLVGVEETAAGYMGGTTEHPTYEDVCGDTTGHAEVVEVMYDPTLISYENLLAVFWDIHDPTQVNKQGPDVGTQYRSVIFYYTDAQRQEAEKSRAARQAQSKQEVSTHIEPAGTFGRAEEYHQKYIQKTGRYTCNESHILLLHQT